MKNTTSSKSLTRAIAWATLLLTLTVFGLTGCACGLLSQGAWSVSESCVKQWQAERDASEQQSQRELPALQKRADAGDAKAQFAMGQFRVIEYHPSAGSTTITQSHPNSDRAAGLAYYYKAGLQGDVQAQRIFVAESLFDCRAKAAKLRRSGVVPASNLPQCTAEGNAMEMLAKNLCVC
jgi:hypothetical protein